MSSGERRAAQAPAYYWHGEFLDWYSGMPLERYEGEYAFYNCAGPGMLMRTWIERGERCFAAIRSLEWTC